MKLLSRSLPLLLITLTAAVGADSFREDRIALLRTAQAYRDISNETLPLINQLDALSRNYGPETDLRAAAERRGPPRARLQTLITDLSRLQADHLRLRPRILERYANDVVGKVVTRPSKTDPGLDRFGRAETAATATIGLRWNINHALELEETAFRALQAADRKRWGMRKALALAGAAALLVAVAMAVFGRRPPRRRRPPTTPGPPSPSYEIIT